jgi:hypothetical protein
MLTNLLFIFISFLFQSALPSFIRLFLATPNKKPTMIRFHKLALGAAFVAAVGMSPSSIVGNVGKKHFLCCAAKFEL